MKNLLLITLLSVVLSGTGYSQNNQIDGNPFARYRTKVSVATFSDNPRFHDHQRIVEIGTVKYDTRTQKIAGFLNTQDTADYLPPEVIGMQPDPHCEKYYSVSPYAYAFNNPVNVIDPNGKDGIYITFPDYRANGVPFTGHAGVLLIDNKTGSTKYYEYGRYQSDFGQVRNVKIPDVKMDGGMPTVESLNNTLSAISKVSGHDGPIEGAYVPSDKFNEMSSYAEKVKNDLNRESYNIIGNNCGTFANDVISQDKGVTTPSIIDPRPVSIIGEYQNSFTPVSYSPGKGTSVKYENKTIQYDAMSKTTSTSQSIWQKIIYGNGK